ncbi:GntR family transcriptional regulator [Stutzerimonas nitrititolerans]|uniref:GntR family transcriptional regulator n=1 Tax=Stutzerimonas nitrititolerans TaxID=2482751 RepID=UPI0028A9738F|nr:FCD domain-containing protein [Stutzerimonas nitrititolerans]
MNTRTPSGVAMAGEKSFSDASTVPRAKMRSLIEVTFHRLRADIVEGRLAAGSRLGVEDLKSRYEVSGGTMREALSLLVAENLVQTQAQRGFHVTPMSLGDMRDLAATRIALESEALRQSVLNGDAEWEARIVSSFHRLSLIEEPTMRDPARWFNEWEPVNRGFHEALISACSSVWIRRFLSILYVHMERYRRLTAMHNPPTRNVHEEHLALRDSALARDAERCAALLAEHIESSISVVREFGLLR